MRPAVSLGPSNDLVADIEQFLIASVEDCVSPDPERTPWDRGRPRLLHDLHLWLAIVLSVVRGEVSQTAVWRLLFTTSLSRYSPIVISDEAVFHRLGGAGTAVLERLFTTVLAVLTERVAPLLALDPRPLAPFATDIVAIDETTLDRVARKVPTLRDVPNGDRRLLPGKLAGVFDVRRQLWRRILPIDQPTQNETPRTRRSPPALC